MSWEDKMMTEESMITIDEAIERMEIARDKGKSTYQLYNFEITKFQVNYSKHEDPIVKWVDNEKTYRNFFYYDGNILYDEEKENESKLFYAEEVIEQLADKYPKTYFMLEFYPDKDKIICVILAQWQEL